MSGGYTASSASLKQTAYQVAGRVVAAALELEVFDTLDDALTELNRVAGTIFEDLSKELPAGGGESRSRSGGKRSGGRSGGGKQGRITIADARDTVIKYGKFGPGPDGSSITLGELFDMTEEETAAFGYDRPGRAYVQWMAKQTEKNPYMARRATLLIDAARAEDNDDDEELEDEEE